MSKATGPDAIIVEMLSASDDFGINKDTDVINELHDSWDIMGDRSRSISIVLPKKPGANECKLHQTLGLANHITRLI